MKMNKVKADALRLVKCLFDSLTEKDNFLIVSLAKSNKESFFCPFGEHMTSYGYKFDHTPDVLENEGIIEVKEPLMWLLEITDMKKRYTKKSTYISPINYFGWEKGYLPKNKIAFFTFKDDDKGKYEYGGVLSVFIVKEKLEKFIKKYSVLDDKNKSVQIEQKRGQVNALSYKWTPNRGKGILEIEGIEPMNFRGSNFGGLNILFMNIGQAVPSNLLRKELAEHLQGNGKTAEQINISKWKTDLKRTRQSFFKYFDITYQPPSKYILIPLKK